MKKVVLFAAIVCSIFCYSLNAVGQIGIPHYVGGSATVTNGSHLGQTGMNQLCLNQYGVGGHMCTTSEFFSTAGNAAAQVQFWAQPSFSNCVYDTSQSAVTCQEAGLSTPFELATSLYNNCTGWTAATGSGTSVQYITNIGWTLVTDADCSVSRRVACCSP